MTEREMKHWLTSGEHATYRWLKFPARFGFFWAIESHAAMEKVALARRDAYIMAKCLESSCFTGADALSDYIRISVLRSKYRGLVVKQARSRTKERSVEIYSLRRRIQALQLTGSTHERFGDKLV